MPSRQNVRNARSRALRALETPEEKLVRREIRNEKDRARRRRAAAIPCMLGVATKYCQSEKTIVEAYFYDEGSWYRNPQE